MPIPIVIRVLVTVTIGLVQGQGDLEIRGRMEVIQTITFGQNTEESPGNLRVHAVAQTPVENHKLALARKSLQKK